jgi:hypothetical protein
MLKAIANYIVSQKIKAASSKIKKAFVQFENIQSVMILANASEYNSVPLKKFIYEIDKKADVVLLHNDKTSKTNDVFLSLNKKDLNFWGIPKPEAATRILSKPFDVLIDCNLKDNLSFKCISGIANAKCKVGAGALSYSDIYDLKIELSNNLSLESYFNQVLNYLRMIKTK